MTDQNQEIVDEDEDELNELVPNICHQRFCFSLFSMDMSPNSRLLCL